MTERHAIATAALVRAGRILLVHRHPDRQWYPDCWDLVGGHIEPGESPEDAVRRECQEEIGVDVGEVRPLAIDFPDPTIDMHGFVVTDWVGEPTNVAPEEHDDLRWFSRDELPGLVLAAPGVLASLLDALG